MLDENEVGLRRVEVTTLFYMPHCGRRLYSNVLRANWSPLLLSKAPIFGNRYSHPGRNRGEDLNSISHRCHLREVDCVWGLTKETISLPLGCLQGGPRNLSHNPQLHAHAHAPN
jgi:hypothetical protein